MTCGRFRFIVAAERTHEWLTGPATYSVTRAAHRPLIQPNPNLSPMINALPDTMPAYVIHAAGGPEQFVATELPVPKPGPGEILIRIRAFGLNRSEWFTRRGDSPGVKFPRVLGIECVGEVATTNDSGLAVGQTVCAMMGGMGRDFDGSYAHYTCVPRASVFAIDTKLSWPEFGALPEMLQTTHGSLHTGLEIGRATNLLVRGGTSSIAYAAIALARAAGLRVTATTRSSAKADALLNAGAHDVLIDTGSIAAAARMREPEGYDRVLELIGATTLADSLAATASGGIVCMTGILGGSWTLDEFRPMDVIPTGVKLTAYSGNASDISVGELQAYVELAERGELNVRSGPVMPFAQLREAHELMDANAANGKIVVVTD
jgi:NADPH:quinone reductase-like Zn-dependent oxidoreductase